MTSAPPTAATETTACPGCGAVLVVVPGLDPRHPGASAGCAALFDVTVHGLRDEAGQHAPTAALLRLATDAYDAQHLADGDPAAPVVRLCLALEHGQDPLRVTDLALAAPRGLTPPWRWTTTLADVAADLDVVDLATLLRSWADAVWADWAPVAAPVRAAAVTALRG